MKETFHTSSQANQGSFATNLINKYIGEQPTVYGKQGQQSNVLMTSILNKPRQVVRSDRNATSGSGIYSLINKNY